MTPINSYKTYTTGMEKSIDDKLFWHDILLEENVSLSTVIDYGCATGELLNRLDDIPLRLGYDINKQMVVKARAKYPSLTFTTSPPILPDSLQTSATLLNLSSVIHEIYSYSSPEVLINYIESNTFDYIAIRDMAITRECSNRESTDFDKFLLNFYAGCNSSFSERLTDFENRQGSIDYQENLIHFLLKYRYIANWDREVKENYLPLTLEDYLEAIDASENYELVYQEHYILPFLAETVKKDTGITLTDPTHLKLLLRRKQC